MNYNYVDIITVLLEPFGPGDPEVVKTAKYDFSEYQNLFDKIRKTESLDLSQHEKELVMDSYRMFLEGVSDADVIAVTGENKQHYLDLYGHLLKEWNFYTPKLKRQSYDSPEYQEKATASGLVDELKW